MHEDLLPLIEELERAVKARDARAAAAVLGRLNEEVIYSGNEVYDRLRSVAGKLGVVLFWGWIVWALVNVRTHFSGHETIGGQVRAGIIYFALLLGVVLAAVLVRLG